MAGSDGNDRLYRWVRIVNKGSGYAGIFNYETSDDKRRVETFTIEEWRSSMAAEFGVQVDAPQMNPNDPPDFFVSVRGEKLNVELVQLVEQEHKKRAMKGETPFAGQLFLDMQWSRERLLSKLRQLIFKKGEKYQKAELGIDVLLIHTGETWLSSNEAGTWISGEKIEPHPSIRSVYLLFSYEPGRGVDHWPIIPVYGDLFKGPSVG